MRLVFRIRLLNNDLLFFRRGDDKVLFFSVMNTFFPCRPNMRRIERMN